MAWTHEMVKVGSESKWECRFCHVDWREPYKGDTPEQVSEKREAFEALGRQICHAAERRSLIYDVGAEAAQKGSERLYYKTQERVPTAERKWLTPWAHSLVVDGRFARDLAEMVVGAGHDGHGELITEFFREIRAERSRLERGQDLIRIEHPVYADVLEVPQ